MYILARGVGTWTMLFISWVTFVRKLWMNPWIICKFVCRGTSVETWPCTSQFLKLEPEILTRDLDRAHQNSTWRELEKKKKKLPTYGQLNVFHDHEMDEKSTDFHFLFWARQVVSQRACSESRVKISSPNSKNWAGHSDSCLFWASWPAQLVLMLNLYERRVWRHAPRKDDVCDHGFLRMPVSV